MGYIPGNFREKTQVINYLLYIAVKTANIRTTCIYLWISPHLEGWELLGFGQWLKPVGSRGKLLAIQLEKCWYIGP